MRLVSSGDNSRVILCHPVEPHSLVPQPQTLAAHSPPRSTEQQRNIGCADTVV